MVPRFGIFDTSLDLNLRPRGRKQSDYFFIPIWPNPLGLLSITILMHAMSMILREACFYCQSLASFNAFCFPVIFYFFFLVCFFLHLRLDTPVFLFFIIPFFFFNVLLSSFLLLDFLLRADQIFFLKKRTALCSVSSLA